MNDPTLGCVAVAATSTCTTRVPGAKSSPKRIVNWLSEAPNTMATSASRTSCMEPSAPKPPATPRSKRSSGNTPRPSAVVSGEGARGVGERAERLARVGEPGAAPGEQQRASCVRERRDGLGEHPGGELALRGDGLRQAQGGYGRRGRCGAQRGGGGCRDPRLLVASPCRVIRSLVGLADLEAGDVVGDREHGRRAVGQRVLDREHGRGGDIRSAHREGARADARGHRDLVDVPGA